MINAITGGQTVKEKKEKKKCDTKILVLLIFCMVCVVLLLVGIKKRWYTESSVIEETTSPDSITVEESEEVRKTSDTYGKTDAGQYISVNMGDSDEFYKPAEGTKTILNFGQGNYDITQDIVKWSFSQPIVNLPQLGEKMGLKFQIEKPKGYVSKTRYEIYSPDDDPDISQRSKVFLVADNGDYICYTIGSRIVEDSKGNVIYTTYPVTLDGETLCIAASNLPYYDGKNLIIGNTVSTQYGSSKVTLTMDKLSGAEIVESEAAAEAQELQKLENIQEGDDQDAITEGISKTDESSVSTE